MKTKSDIKSAAILTVKDAPKMSATGKKAIANWLRRQATMLEREGKHYSARFTARYLYAV